MSEIKDHALSLVKLVILHNCPLYVYAGAYDLINYLVYVCKCMLFEKFKKLLVANHAVFNDFTHSVCENIIRKR